MSLRQLAERAGVSKTAVASLERNEVRGTAQLDSLAKIADALDCDLVYAVVPRTSLAGTLDARARSVAEELVGRVAESMELEAQGTADSERVRLVREAAEQLRRRPSGLWDA